LGERKRVISISLFETLTSSKNYKGNIKHIFEVKEKDGNYTSIDNLSELVKQKLLISI